MSEPWATAGIDAESIDALACRLPASRLWSLLLNIVGARRSPRILDQWQRDAFTAPSAIDHEMAGG